MIGSPASDKPGQPGSPDGNDVSAAGPNPAPVRPGLRERKKARTRQTIQEHALRLFREQGYDETTVEQIADAAEVSPSTFFRYFGSKEDVVIYDALDPILIEAWHQQPTELGPIQAMRKAMTEVFGSLSEEMRADLYERARLVYGVPALRLAMIDDLFRTQDLMASEVAARTGRAVDSFEVRAFTGALIGAVMASMLPLVQDPSADFPEIVDRVFAYIEEGLPL
jgi:AcrR family transcriptional regulator